MLFLLPIVIVCLGMPGINPLVFALLSTTTLSVTSDMYVHKQYTCVYMFAKYSVLCLSSLPIVIYSPCLKLTMVSTKNIPVIIVNLTTKVLMPIL